MYGNLTEIKTSLLSQCAITTITVSERINNPVYLTVNKGLVLYTKYRILTRKAGCDDDILPFWMRVKDEMSVWRHLSHIKYQIHTNNHITQSEEDYDK